LRATLLIIALLFVTFFLRLIDVQAVNAKEYAERATRELTRTAKLPAPRGEITDRNGHVLARSIESLDLVVDQTLINRPQRAAEIVAPIIGESTSYVKSRLTGTRKFVYVARDITPAQWKSIKAALVAENAEVKLSKRIGGFFSERGFRRDYPEKYLAASLLGFVNSAGVGGGGMESSLNSTLAGKDGIFTYENGGGPSIPSSRQILIPPQPGKSVRLTIDRDLQWAAEDAITALAKETKASSVSAVIIDPATGEILALATAPGFDPNNFSQTKASLLKIPSVQDIYEPGSTGKVMTMAAALEEKVVTPTTVFKTPDKIRRAGKTFNDHDKHSVWKLTATGILAKSSNVGTIKISERMSENTLYSYLRKFGIGERVKLGLPAEPAGILNPVEKWSGSTFPTVSFGQSYSVTAIQATSVFATIANAGLRVTPTLVAGTSDSSGHYTAAPRPESQRVISQDVARQLSAMMESVVQEGGTAVRAAIPGYRVAGKTGTAQRYDGSCGCYRGYTASFIGFAPADKPRFVMSVTVQNPVGIHWGGYLGGPVFKSVISYALKSYRVPPTGVELTPYPLDKKGLDKLNKEAKIATASAKR
jgi:cell division protein FtsI (penicillin-binding protein 3)